MAFGKDFADAANLDVETGSFRTVNLVAPPFSFPPALELIDDYAKGHTPHQLGLWLVDDVRSVVRMHVTPGLRQPPMTASPGPR